MTWELVNLGNVCEVVRGGSPRPIIDYITKGEEGVNWLKIGDVNESDKYFRYTNEKIKPSGISKTREVVAGDLILSNSMSFGRAFITLINGYIHDGWLRLRPNEKVLDKDYLYYFLTSNIAQNQFKAIATGSVVNNLKSDTVKAAKVFLPPIKIQKKIADYLNAIDGKIEINKQINNNLEQQAMALFKSWFIDYEPYNRTVPNNWVEYKLSDFLPVITGKKNANVSSSIGTYPFFSCSQDITWTDEYSFEGNAILVAGNGDFNVKFYNGKFEAYQRTYVLIPHNSRFSAWLFYAVKYDLNKITAAARGSVIKFITKGNLEDFSFYAPLNLYDFDVIDQFTAINNIIASNREENACLSDLRDTLLPKLMSGELDVSDIEL